jgi:hypothetical protein
MNDGDNGMNNGDNAMNEGDNGMNNGNNGMSNRNKRYRRSRDQRRGGHLGLRRSRGAREVETETH